MDKIYNFLLETWRANLESNLHPLTKILLAIFMWALPLATAIEIFKYLTLEGWTTLIFICTTILLSLSTIYLYRNRYLVNQKEKNITIKEKQIESLKKDLESELNNLKSDLKFSELESNSYLRQLNKLKDENSVLNEKLYKLENQKKKELLTLEEQNNAIKNLAQKQIDERIKIIESEYNKKLADEKRTIEKDLKAKYEDLKINFERQYLEDVERSAKIKAKEFINKELPFDI